MIIKESLNTPYIELDSDKNYVLFRGESRPEDVRDFYMPVMDWLQVFKQKLRDATEPLTVNCDFQLTYFNSSSAKYVLDILEFLKDCDKLFGHITVKINWYHDPMDEDLLEAGKEFEELSGFKLNYIEVD